LASWKRTAWWKTQGIPGIPMNPWMIQLKPMAKMESRSENDTNSGSTPHSLHI
jgi:hypothetical protein